ncbi:DUF202 domain-containing protein [Ornithinimicrobium cavernae]|uniref:DUF202 domain-containing protein n=1 Tax=Ornithinimicrobium cavernae TaxID=2666047 RepID=UPI000D69A97D|nr:DUF202 domain-containing protein [Ornithinimicrobium cavernae]
MTTPRHRGPATARRRRAGRSRRLPTVTTAAHLDRGLQPERATLAWSRTCLALVTISAIFLRWVSHYGAWLLVLPAIALVAAVVITDTQRIRTNRGVHGIHRGSLTADPLPPLMLVGVVLALGVAGACFALVAP